MSGAEITQDTIIVMGNERSPVFCVAVVALNQKHGQAGEIKEWIHEALPRKLANELAKKEGERRELPVIVWAQPTAAESR